VYLSRLVLNPGNGRVRRDLGDCHELHRTVLSAFPTIGGEGQGTEGARSRLGVLFRLEPTGRDGRVVVLVQSAATPDWSALVTSRYVLELGAETPKDVTRAYGGIRPGDELTFRLRANPTKKVETKSGPNGGRRNGRRVALVKENDQLGWLARKAEAGGFRLLRARARSGLEDVLPGYVPPEAPTADARPVERSWGWRGREGTTGKASGQRLVPAGNGSARRERLVFGDVLFQGRLAVTDAEHFRRTLATGIGSGKAYGFGLLSVAPAR
jgi:CRISPR system Cascade subunit CasE